MSEAPLIRRKVFARARAQKKSKEGRPVSDKTSQRYELQVSEPARRAARQGKSLDVYAHVVIDRDKDEFRDFWVACYTNARVARVWSGTPAEG